MNPPARVVLTVALILLALPSARADDSPDARRWWSHVLFLADDKLEGRATGSEGHRTATAYVAAEFERIGLKPAGTAGFFQTVKLRSRELDESHSSLSLIKQTGTEPLILGEDAIISSRVDPAPTLDAEMVFVGYGLTIKEPNHDDFKDLDVRGKVVVYLNGAPPAIPGPLAAHMQSSLERAAVWKRVGAIGAAAIPNPKNMDIPWDRMAVGRSIPSMTFTDPAMDEDFGQKIAFTINPARADKLLSGSGHNIQEILAAADAGTPLPHFPLPARLHTKVAVKSAELQSQNVVALLPGTDSTLKNEYVVFSAHLDHLGVAKPINGDAIYNGAMDNASGVASLLAVAAALKQSNTSLRRSIVFLAVTGEEKGLLGSRFFARFPTVDARKIVADINTDMFLPLFPLRKLTIFGIDESDLGADAIAVARASGVEPQADPEPKRNRFIRSDQYSFIRQGVPSLALKVGFDKGTPEEQLIKNWLKDRYHAPSDDVKQPVDKQAAGEFNELVAKLLERIANRDERPRWKETSFFKRFAE